MKLRSFGCSFVYGSDLLSPNNAWPALIAKDLDLPYECHAIPGAGNLQILESILKHSNKHDISIINWTWIDRFDFIDKQTEEWKTLRPSLDQEHADYYFRNLHGQYRDMLTNLIYINTAVDFLKDHRCIMTGMDYLLFEDVNPRWHDPGPIQILQNKLRPHIKHFEEKNFLDWSRDNGHRISEKWHPLETAHRAASEYWLVNSDVFKKTTPNS